MTSLQAMFRNFPEFNFGRYLLRKPDISDCFDIERICGDEYTMEMIRAPIIKNDYDSENFINMINIYYTLKYRIDWIIYDKVDKRGIGLFSIHNISFIDDRVDIGFVLEEKYRRKGIMRFIVNSMIKELFENYNVHMIIMIVLDNNKECLMFCESLNIYQQICIKEYYYNKINRKYEDVQMISLINSNT